jgi:hypothetical protein
LTFFLVKIKFVDHPYEILLKPIHVGVISMRGKASSPLVNILFFLLIIRAIGKGWEGSEVPT